MGLAFVLALAALVYASVTEITRSVPASLTIGSISSEVPLVSIGPSKDNTLYETPTGSHSNGAGQYFFAGTTSLGVLRRGVVAFDIDGSIPAGSTISSVSLELHMSRTVSGPETIELRRLLADWGEGTSRASGEEGGGTAATPGDATWVHRFFDTDTWATPGGDFLPTASACMEVAQEDRYYTWGSTAAMVADVQGWLDNPSSNFGWLLLGNEARSLTAKRFDTKENGNPDFHPVLTVRFGPASPPPGDANRDGVVDAADLRFVADNMGRPDDPRADLTGECFVDIRDLAIVGRNFGE